MNSVILQIAAKYIKGILILFALIALFRGHNYPGGGFIGGLLAALSVIYYGFAFNIKEVKQKQKVAPATYIAIGLFLVVLSILPGLFSDASLLKGIWYKIPMPFGEDLKLGTPFIFDIGVFLTVIGVTFLFFFSLSKVE